MAIAMAVLVAALSHPKPPPEYPALASWYDDAGQTASGTHYPLGFASLMFGSEWGRRITFCYRSRCVTGRLQDHGPYVAGREFDLNAGLKVALRCPDLCWLRWRRWRAPRVGAVLVLGH